MNLGPVPAGRVTRALWGLNHVCLNHRPARHTKDWGLLTHSLGHQASKAPYLGVLDYQLTTKVVIVGRYSTYEVVSYKYHG